MHASIRNLGMKSGDVSVMRRDVNAQFVGAAEVQIAHVAHVDGVEVQQFVTEQRLVTTQFHLAHLRPSTRPQQVESMGIALCTQQCSS